MKKKTDSWILIAEYDLKSAKVSLDNEMYLKVVESCHSALEKMLKALISETSDSPPPRIHNLLKLVSQSVLQNMRDETKKILDEINDYYMRTRYPSDFEKIVLELEKDKATNIYNKTKEIVKWLKQQIKKS